MVKRILIFTCLFDNILRSFYKYGYEILSFLEKYVHEKSYPSYQFTSILLSVMPSKGAEAPFLKSGETQGVEAPS